MNKNYITRISQTDDNAPSISIVQNTLGEIIWSRQDAGIFVGIGIGLFPEDSTFIELKYQSGNGIAPITNPWGWSRNSDDQITIITDEKDNQLYGNLLIITVYEKVINYNI